MAAEKPTKDSTVPYPGMMGDETIEQNLDQTGDPSARISQDDVEAAFGKESPKEPADKVRSP